VIAFTLLLCFLSIILNPDKLSELRLLDNAQLGEQEDAAPEVRYLGEEHYSDHRVNISATKGAPIRKATTASGSVPYWLVERAYTPKNSNG
jgi:hypothetical protein